MYVQIRLEHGLIYEAARLHCFFTTGQTFNLEKGDILVMKYTNEKIQKQIQKYKYPKTYTQIQIHRYTNTNEKENHYDVGGPKDGLLYMFPWELTLKCGGSRKLKSSENFMSKKYVWIIREIISYR